MVFSPRYLVTLSPFFPPCYSYLWFSLKFYVFIRIYTVYLSTAGTTTRRGMPRLYDILLDFIRGIYFLLAILSD